MHAPVPRIEPILEEALDLPYFAHAFFTRKGGISTGLYAGLNTGIGSKDDRALVLQNRARAAAYVGARPDRLATPYQVHGTDAVIVEEAWGPGLGPKADAVVTDRPGLVIGVGTADCGPVLFADPGAGVVGAAHAGWKGALAGILESTLNAMEQRGAERSRTIAVLGPTISVDRYEVGREFVDMFRRADPENERFFQDSERPGHARFDLPAYIVARLQAAGVALATAAGHCTYSDEERFFSYRRATHRREPDYGRLLAAIMIRES